MYPPITPRSKSQTSPIRAHDHPPIQLPPPKKTHTQHTRAPSSSSSPSFNPPPNKKKQKHTYTQQGAILVFLPGWDDISRLRDLMTRDPVLGREDKYWVLPLHSGEHKNKAGGRGVCVCVCLCVCVCVSFLHSDECFFSMCVCVCCVCHAIVVLMRGGC